MIYSADGVSNSRDGVFGASHSIARPFVRNLSGDFSVTANWFAQDAGVTVEAMTVSAFQAEQPAAAIPYGHVTANGVLKISVTTTGAAYRLRGKNLSGPSFSGLRSLVSRMYMPANMADRFAGMSTGNTLAMFFMASAYGDYSDYFSKAINFRPSSGSVGMQPGNFSSVIVPARWTATAGLQQTLSGVGTVVGSPGSGSLEWIEFGIRGDAAASPGNPLVIYLFDVVSMWEALPKIYFRWDDATDSHLGVSSNMRNGTKFGGGSLACSLHSTFCIIPGVIGTAGYLTRANLRTMVAEGSELCCHGVGGTWSAYSDAEILAEINSIRAIYALEGWKSRWSKTLAFPGNDNYSDTTSTSFLADLISGYEFKFNTGHANFGYGFSMGALDNPLNRASIVSIGQSSASAVGNATDAETLIAHMAESGLSIVTMGHRVGAAPGSIDVTESEFDSIMDVFATEIASSSRRIGNGDLILDADKAGVFD